MENFIPNEAYEHENMGYKIRRSDGLFSTGGSDPGFNARGKVWWTKGALTSHVKNVVLSRYGGEQYFDVEIVEYRVDYEFVAAQTVANYMEERENKKAKEEEERLARKVAAGDEERRRLYIELNQEFGPQT